MHVRNSAAAARLADRLQTLLPASWVRSGSLSDKLVQAGYDGPSAPVLYVTARLALAVGLPFLALTFAPRTSPGKFLLLVGLSIFVGLLAPRTAGEHVDARRWAGLVLGLIGATEVILARQGVDAPSAGALLCAVAALATLTAGTLYENRFGGEHHPVTANLVQYAIALAVVTPAAALFEDNDVSWTANLVVSLAYLVLANSLLAISLLLAMLRRGEAARVSALFFLTPPLAALIAFLVLGERLPAAAWPGMAVAAVGVALATRVSGPKPRAGPAR
jgi:drug/metabolite transporter (DMT)-like permease